MSERIVEKGSWPFLQIPPSWDWWPFDKVLQNVTDSERKLKEQDYLPSGRYAVVDQGADLIGGYTDRADLINKESPPFIVFGDHTRCVKFVGYQFVQGADGVKVLKVPTVEPRYAFWALQTLRLPNKWYSRHYRYLRDSEFPVAPLAEQRRIVAKIEELFSDLDAGVAALERVKANLKRYRAAVLKAAVEGKLTAQWRAKHPNTEPASILLERILAERRKKWEADQLAKFAAAGKQPPKNWRDKYQEPAAPDTTNLPALPKGWCWATVEQFAAVSLGGL